MPTKTNLRKKLLPQLKSNTPKYIQYHSDQIFLQLQKHISKFQTRFIFLSLPREVKTDALISYLRKHKKIIIVPHMTEKTMQLVHYKPSDKLIIWKYNIREVNNPKIFNGKVDVTITPWLAFDSQNYRLGRGKWNYDKFFSQHPETFKIWVAFPEQIVAKVPTDKHDTPMNNILFW